MNVLSHPRLKQGIQYAIVLAKQMEYLQHLRNNSLDQIMIGMGLHGISDIIDNNNNNSDSSNCVEEDYCNGAFDRSGHYQEILMNQLKLIHLEEIHSMTDVGQYDLHYLKISGQYKQHYDSSSGRNIVTTTISACIHIKGSSEGRPRIALGDQIFLRPVQEDVHIAFHHSSGNKFER